MPVWYGADGVEVIVGLCPGVLLGDVGAEFDMGSDGLPERFVVGEPGLVEGLEVERDEAVALLVADLQVAVDIDDVLEAELLCEAAGAAERLGREPGQVVDVGGDAFGEERLQDRVCERLLVEDFLQAV